MSKYSLSAASLVTAIPAGFLAYVLVMAFLQKPGFDKMPGFFQIISGLALTLVTLMVLMPVGILIFGRKPDKAPEPKAEPDDGEDIEVDDKAKSVDDGEDIEVEDEADDLFEEDEFGDDEFGDDEGFDDFEDEEEDEFK